MVSPIHFIVPGTAVPVVVAGKVEDARSHHIQRNVAVLRLLVEEVAGIGTLVPTGPVVRAAHIGAHADPQSGPRLPHAVSVIPDGDYREHVIAARQPWRREE